MGSLFTSIIPNLICKEIIKAIDKSDAKIMYCCNIVTQPGESDDFKASDHIDLLNSYLGERKINVGIFNIEHMDPELVLKYETEEQKDPVILDKENLNGIEIIEDDLITDIDGTFKHDTDAPLHPDIRAPAQRQPRHWRHFHKADRRLPAAAGRTSRPAR